MSKRVRGWAWLGGLLGLAIGSSSGATDGTAAPPRQVEVLLQIPASNFVYRQGNQLVFGPSIARADQSAVPWVLHPGVSVVTSMGINLAANVLAAGLEALATQTAREAAGPVGESIGDIDLGASVFENLRVLTPAGGPQWVAGSGAFPSPEAQPVTPEVDAITGRPVTTEMDPVRLLSVRAASSSYPETLFIRILPLFRGFQGRMYVSVASMLFDKSGKKLGEWNVQVMAPEAPNLERADLVRWWADGRYRRFLAQGLRAGLVPLAEEVANPALRASRQKLLQAITAQRFDESGRPMDPLLQQGINTEKKRSTACMMEDGQRALTYRFERTRNPTHLFAAGYCVGEQISDWTQEVVPGLSWTYDVTSPPPLVSQRPQ